jgi:succinyldiaminopimelate transaminase
MTPGAAVTAFDASPSGLPEFPWDRLAPYGQLARAYPGGIVDLSVGTPVDPTPEVVREALRAASDAPGYPTTQGTAELRAAIVDWFARRLGVTDLDPGSAVIPSIGSKEAVAWLPTLLGLGRGDQVAFPTPAYPTYDVGARLAGAEPLPTPVARLAEVPAGVRLIWLNSPANPHGEVMSREALRAVVEHAREIGAVVACDECYIELGWDTSPTSILHPDVVGNDHTNVLALNSLSKRSNLAGYRAAFVAGDARLVSRLLEIRKHAGMIVPAPVQAAMTAALRDDEHVERQRERYAARRSALREALLGAGFRIDHSRAGLYLWATRDEHCWDTVAWLADRGVLAAPGEFYGDVGERYIRVALTATDERVAAAVERLAVG